MRRAIACISAFISLAACLAVAQSIPQDLWKQFREQYPYHIQTTALSARDSDGSRVLIITEPPPHVTLADFVALSPKYLSGATIRKQKVGYDGWVKDIVVPLAPSDERTLRELLDRINYYLFQTTYKASPLPLPAARGRDTAVPLDIRVTTADLNRWLIAGRLTFAGIGERRSWTAAQLLETGRDGVYLSDEPGMAIWVLPRSGDYSRFRREARQFALDSDLIVGAIANATHLAVVARERILPLDIFPPLRSETVLQLAAVASASLSQSYERNYILAGKYDGERDWAPIYLSDSLIDTEYGSLLNLTDQLLKSWSMAGLVKYVDFPYPTPRASYPFPGGLAGEPDIKKSLDESDEGLTFNWNTNGAGYIDAIAGFKIYAINRTGALPVSYLSGGTNGTGYEKKAYKWFAEETRDANLARVVQYAALYQIFHEFRIRPVVVNAGSSKQPNTAGLASAIGQALKAIRTYDCSTSQNHVSGQKSEDLHRLMHLLGLDKLEHSCELIGEIEDEYANSGIQTLAAQLASGGRSEADLKLWLSVLSRRREDRAAYVDSLPIEKRRWLDAMIVSQDIGQDPEFRRALEKHIPLEKAREMYLAGANRPEGGWIHTASIVVSWPTGAFADYVGGHNLDAKIGRFVADSSVERGDIRIFRENGERVIHYNPADGFRMPEWLHDASVTKDDATLLASVRKTFRIPPDVPPDRTLSAALGLDGGKRVERGLTSDLAGTKGSVKRGWGDTIEPTQREAAAIQGLQTKPTRFLNVERLEDGYYRVLEGQTGRVYMARSITDVMDTVVTSLKRSPGKPPTTLVLAGFEEEDAVSFRETAELWMQREGLPGQRVSTARVMDETIPIERAVQPLSEQGDLLRARFGEWELNDITLPSGKRGRVYQTTVEVPPKVGGIGGFVLKVKVNLLSLFQTSQQLMMTRTRATAILSNISKDMNAAEAAAAVERDLRARVPQLHSVILELSGIVTAEREPGSKVDAYSPAN